MGNAATATSPGSGKYQADDVMPVSARDGISARSVGDGGYSARDTGSARDGGLSARSHSDRRTSSARDGGLAHHRAGDTSGRHRRQSALTDSSRGHHSSRRESTARPGGAPGARHVKQKGVRPLCRTETDLMIPRVCINLCTLAHLKKSHERDNFVSTVEKDTKWAIHIDKYIKVVNYNIFVRKRWKPCALVGTVTSLDGFGEYQDTPFIAFRGEEATQKMVEAFQKPIVQETFVTSEGNRLGHANSVHVKALRKLMNTGLREWINDTIKATKASNIIITGNANGGALAALFATELIVDHSKLHVEHGNYASGGGGDESGSPQHNNPLGDANAHKFYLIPDLDLITFGAPKTFDKITAHKLMRLSFHSRVQRFVNSGDILPTLPHSKQGSMHIGDPIFQRLSNNGWYKYPGKPTMEYDKLHYLAALRAGGGVHNAAGPSGKGPGVPGPMVAGPGGGNGNFYGGKAVPMFSIGPNTVKRYREALFIVSPIGDEEEDEDDDYFDEEMEDEDHDHHGGDDSGGGHGGRGNRSDKDVTRMDSTDN